MALGHSMRQSLNPHEFKFKNSMDNLHDFEDLALS
jgi:hypothetical protein